MAWKMWVSLGAVLAAIGVGLGAYHAHGLEKLLAALQLDDLPKRLGQFEAGVRYQMYHALALVLVGVLAQRTSSTGWTIAGSLFVAGIALFSGLLFGLALSEMKILGLIVPIGGLCLIAAWIVVAITAVRAQ
jgi:uncharacterized membrane protein YgdD (TMEM256/DUF423 family)